MKLLTLQKTTPIVDKQGNPTNYFLQYEQQGFSGTVTIAKLTGGGTNGFLTFFQGRIVGVQEPT